MPGAYYNDNEPSAVQWTRNLIKAKLIPAGDVDGRPIEMVQPEDLRGYTQWHLFCGVNGWPMALRKAEWDDSRSVFTGSSPCQALSTAGKQLGDKDVKRHLWPHMFRLIEALRPPVVFGEQVASKLGREWFSGVRRDLQSAGYDVAGSDLCAASVGAPHIRQRLYFVAERLKK